jgi:hypothetical protein
MEEGGAFTIRATWSNGDCDVNLAKEQITIPWKVPDM